ncbi:MAG: TonB-dependent siderophore receptor [Hyphomicrobiaceae bacterium]
MAEQAVDLPSEPATALGSYNPALDVDGLKAPPGVTLTTAGPVAGYRALSAMSSTKTATPLEQIPQSIQVLPKSLLDDQRPASIGQVLQNVSNTQGPNDLGIGNSDMTPVKIRGFGADQWLDGMAVLYGTGHRDALSNIERIEVLKGPSAILYGGGAGAPIGGAVNMISKLPTNKASGEVGLTMGSYDYYRTFFDINQPVTSNGTVLFRFTGEYSGASSFVDVLESERYALNPTVTFTDKSDTTLTVQGSFSKFSQQAYPGLPAVGTVAGDFRINPKMFAGDPNIIPSFTKRESITATLDHRFDPVWSFNVKGRYSKSVNQQDSQGPISASPDVGPTTWSLLNVNMHQEQQEFTINPNVRAKFTSGITKNTVLFGADYSRVTDEGIMYSDFGVMPVDLTDPIFLTPYTKPDPLSPFFFPWYDFKGTYTTKGAYAQLQTSVAGSVHLLAGARLANLNVNYFERVPFGMAGFAPPETFTVDKSKVLPRAGIVVDLVPGLSAFGSYSEGMRWTAFTQARNLAPEESQQLEGGFKYKIGQQLSGTASVFDIKRSNVPVTVGAGVSDYAGQHSRGFEADAIWQPTSQWQVLAAYGYTDATYSDDKLLTPKGNNLPIVPAHSGRIWIDYAFTEQLKGLSIGAGIYASSSQFVDNLNLYKTQGYVTVDSKIAYDTQNWTASLNMKNLTGEKYFVPYSWFGGQVAPGTDRAYYGTFVYKY